MVVQEWEAFTGLIVSDTKNESDKDIPNWIEPDRTPALLLLKVTSHSNVIFMSTPCTVHHCNYKNGKGFPYSLLSVGPELIPVYRQSARR